MIPEKEKYLLQTWFSSLFRMQGKTFKFTSSALTANKHSNCEW